MVSFILVITTWASGKLRESSVEFPSIEVSLSNGPSSDFCGCTSPPPGPVYLTDFFRPREFFFFFFFFFSLTGWGREKVDIGRGVEDEKRKYLDGVGDGAQVGEEGRLFDLGIISFSAGAAGTDFGPVSDPFLPASFGPLLFLCRFIFLIFIFPSRLQSGGPWCSFSCFCRYRSSFLVASLLEAEVAAGAPFQAQSFPWVVLAVRPLAGEECLASFVLSCPHLSIPPQEPQRILPLLLVLLVWALSLPFYRDTPLLCVPVQHMNSSKIDVIPQPRELSSPVTLIRWEYP